MTALADAEAACAHCAGPVRADTRFCCAGCAAAHDMIETLGLGRYYRQRVLDPAMRAPRPAEGGEQPVDPLRHATIDRQGEGMLHLMVDGLHCGACVWLIESVMSRDAAVVEARINLTTRRLRLRWRGAAPIAALERVAALGYRLVPYDPAVLSAAVDATGRALLRALAVAGFAAGNVMMISIAIWAGFGRHGMGVETRDMLHWVSAAIALPAIAYAGRPFFRSAWGVLRHGRTNMDVPISLGVLLVAGMSLAETARGAAHAYFDSATVLLFFLLIGRYLDHRARGRMRATAEQLLILRATDIGVLDAEGAVTRQAPETVGPGARVLIGLGERVGVDGVIEAGRSMLDTSLVTGESLPVAAGPGDRVFAGTLNQGAALTVRVLATGEATLLAECLRLIEAAAAARGRFVVLADRIARRYAPAVHVLALATLLVWRLLLHAPWSVALLNASAVLIVTCPCALALAVPAVQVIATGRLFRAGILVKSPTALERLAAVDTVVFDKTGTLTEPTLALAEGMGDAAGLRVAAGLAAASRHPLARALAAAMPGASAAAGVVEHPGQGLALGAIRLGSRAFCGIADAAPPAGPELWLTRPGHAALRFAFAEKPRADAAQLVAGLMRQGFGVEMLSGDTEASAARIAELLGIRHYAAGCTPVAKLRRLEALAAAGRRVAMVGDGLNDAPALAAALVSISPASAADISQNAADAVFQGAWLAPVGALLATARRARRLIAQNLGCALAYNLLFVPLAMAGQVTPWLAAAAMSGSSLAVIANSFRFRGPQRP